MWAKVVKSGKCGQKVVNVLKSGESRQKVVKVLKMVNVGKKW